LILALASSLPSYQPPRAASNNKGNPLAEMAIVADPFGLTACRRLSSQWVRVRIDSNITVAVAPSTESSVVRLRILLRSAGAESDPCKKLGLTALMIPLLRAGNRNRTVSDLEGAVEGIGADLLSTVDWDSSAITIDALADDAVAALLLLRDVVMFPSFPQAAVGAAVAARLRQLEQRRLNPSSAADDRLWRLLVGDAKAATTLGEIRSVRELTRDDAVGHHAERVESGPISLIASGAVRVDDILKVARELKPRASVDQSGCAPLSRAVGPSQRRVHVLDCRRSCKTA
jgi:zinc protease